MSSQFNSKYNIKYYIKENDLAKDFFENQIYNYGLNLYAGRERENEVHAHEIDECLRKSLVYREYKIKIDSLTTAYHFTIGNLYEKMISEILLWESWKYRIIERESKIIIKKRSYNGYALVGNIDFDTKVPNLGIVEIKSVKQFGWLHFWSNSNVFVSSPYNPSKRKEVGPHYNHLDRLLTYLIISNRTVASIIYISKYATEGILIFTIKINNIAKKNLMSKIDKIMEYYTFKLNKFKEYKNKYNFSNDFKEFERRHIKKLKDPEYEFIQNIIAFPSISCMSCRLGGLKSSSRPTSEYPNFCNIPIKWRKYDQSIFGKIKTEVRKELKKPNPKNPAHLTTIEQKSYPRLGGVEISENRDQKNKIEGAIIDYLVKKFLWKNNFDYIFKCPRLIYYYNNNNMKNIYNTSERNKNLAIWGWRNHMLRLFLYKVYDPNCKAHNFEFPIKINGKEIKYKGIVYRVKEKLTIIITTGSINTKTINTYPRESDLLMCASLQILFNESPIRLVYHGIRSTNMLVYDVYIDDEDKDKIIKIIKQQIIESNQNKPRPDIYCKWCPLSEKICPEGKDYLEESQLSIYTIKDVMKYTKVLINNKIRVIPKYDGGVFEDIILNDELEQEIRNSNFNFD